MAKTQELSGWLGGGRRKGGEKRYFVYEKEKKKKKLVRASGYGILDESKLESTIFSACTLAGP